MPGILADRSSMIHRMEPVRAWERAMRARGLSERTVRERTRMVCRVAAEVGRPARLLTTDDLADWFAALDASPGTRATYRSHLAAWFRWLILDGRRDDDPMIRLGVTRLPRYQPRPLTDGQVRAVLATRMHKRTRVMILLALFAGLRVSEIAAVKGEDIRGGVLAVVGKGGVRAELPVHPILARVAAGMPRRGWWFRSHTRPGEHVRGKSVSRIIAGVLARAGVVGTPHQLRHWYGTSLHRQGTDLRVVQELMRHASPATTARYVLVDSDRLRAAIATLHVA